MSEQITNNPSVPSQVVAEVTFPKFINNLGIIPTSYKDSMSYYECLAWLCKYLEETVVPTVNQNGEAVEELQNLYVELNSYVTNYFDNLDVQEEINNKLDEMVTTGQLQALLNLQYTDLLTEVNSQLNNMNDNITNINNKVNDLVNINPIPVSSTSDMTDTDRIYLLTTSGKWYYYNGESWAIGGDYQSSGFSDNSIDIKFTNPSIYDSLYNKSIIDCTGIGTVNNSTGEIDTSATSKIYFEIDSISLNNQYFCFNTEEIELFYVAFYVNDIFRTTKLGSQAPNSVYGKGFKIGPYDSNKIIVVAKKTSGDDFTSDEITSLKLVKFTNKIEKIENSYTINDKMITFSKMFSIGGIGSDGTENTSQLLTKSKLIRFNNNNGKRILYLNNMDEQLYVGYIVKYLNGSFVERVALSTRYYDIVPIETNNTFNGVRLILQKINGSSVTSTEMNAITITKKYEFNKKLEGKMYSAIGDSITYGFIPRNYTGYPGQLNSYLELACQKLGMISENAGISGSTISNVEGRNPMCNRYSSLNDNADFISVMGGTNDFRQNVTLGTINDTSDTTFYGALKKLAQGLYDKYFINQGTTKGQNKKIFFITPLKLLQTSSSEVGGNGTNYDLSLWVKAIKDVAEMYSFPVLDLYNCSLLNPALSQTVEGTETGYTGNYNPYMTDGTHPTQEGQEIISDIVAGFIESLI